MLGNMQLARLQALDFVNGSVGTGAAEPFQFFVVVEVRVVLRQSGSRHAPTIVYGRVDACDVVCVFDKLDHTRFDLLKVVRPVELVEIKVAINCLYISQLFLGVLELKLWDAVLVCPLTLEVFDQLFVFLSKENVNVDRQ